MTRQGFISMRQFTVSRIVVATFVLASLSSDGFTAPARWSREACQANPPASQDEMRGRNWTLSEKLDVCNGVLRPPNTGDREMVRPAPDIGETPVIRPDDLPPRGNPTNGRN
ncbi:MULTISPECIES: hypothetical protein [unclassified Sinorhizobium]|uniref:hypothetical protein n=1 Tax=unclassified Sinorhizobium TaxID=2613772 RepID=UPI00352348C0